MSVYLNRNIQWRGGWANVAIKRKKRQKRFCIAQNDIKLLHDCLKENVIKLLYMHLLYTLFLIYYTYASQSNFFIARIVLSVLKYTQPSATAIIKMAEYGNTNTTFKNHDTILQQLLQRSGSKTVTPNKAFDLVVQNT